MLFSFNGVYKDTGITVDTVMINPFDYDLNENYIWFVVGISVNDEIDLLSIQFCFYLMDRNKKFLNQVSQIDSTHYEKTNNHLEYFVGFEFELDFFYTIPIFGFYCDTYNKVELIELTC